MAPISHEQKVEWWRRLHYGKGSVIQRSWTTSKRSYLTFITPSGEKFDSYTKALAYAQVHKHVVKTEMDVEENAGFATQQLSVVQNEVLGSCVKLSNDEKRDFREWFWRKKGGFVLRRQYPDKGSAKGIRWESRYILPGPRRVFRSWKECVRFMGVDPDPSATSWKLERNDQDIGPTASCFPTTQGQLLHGVPSSTSAGTDPQAAPQIDNDFHVPAPAETNMENKFAGHSKSGPRQLSEDSSSEESRRPPCNQEEDGPENDNQGSKVSMRGAGILSQNNEAAAGEKQEKLSESQKFGKLQSFVPEPLKSITTAAAVGTRKKERSRLGKTSKRRRRFMMLSSCSGDETSSTDEAHGDSDIIIEEGGSTHGVQLTGSTTAAPPQVTTKLQQQAKDKSLTAAQPAAAADGRLRMSSEKNRIKKKDHGQTAAQKKCKALGKKRQMSHSAAATAAARKPPSVTFHGDSNYGGTDQKGLYHQHHHGEGGPSIVDVDDETLQRNLINLLYADFIKQPSKRTYTNSDVIGKLYAEFIERSFTRSTSLSHHGAINHPSALSPAAATNRKRKLKARD